MAPKKIILASTSPRRKQVMDELGILYEIVPSEFEEKNELYSDPYELVQEFAYQKAKHVLEIYPDAIVIGSDSIVADADGVPRGKAKDYNDALQILQKLQGRICKIITAVAVLSLDKKLIGQDEASVSFKSMSDNEIRGYLDDPEEEWKGRAGAFAAQGKAQVWIEKIDGEWGTVIGLSRELLKNYLREAGVKI